MMSPMSRIRSIVRTSVMAVVVGAAAPPAFAQLDPLLVLKDPSWAGTSLSRLSVIIAMDTSERMQRDAANDYYDPVTYTHNAGNGAVETLFGLPGTVNTYRR